MSADLFPGLRWRERHNLPTKKETVTPESLLIVRPKPLDEDGLAILFFRHIDGSFRIVFEFDNLPVHYAFDRHVACLEVIFSFESFIEQGFIGFVEKA